MRKIHIINNIVHLFPYDLVQHGESIVLYGFGKVGHNYYDQILANNYCNIKYIVDKDWKKYDDEGYPVKSPESLKNEKETRIVIALAKKSKQILEILKEYKIDDKRVIFNDTVVGNPINVYDSNSIEIYEMSAKEAQELYGEPHFAQMKRIRSLLLLGGGG